MSGQTERAEGLARISAAFEQYSGRPHPVGSTLLENAYQRGDEANGAFCALVGWLKGLVDSDVPMTAERLAEAIEHAALSVLADTETKDPQR